MMAKIFVVLFLLASVPWEQVEARSQQWKNFQRDWDILMTHIFRTKEEEDLVNCCPSGQKQQLNACLKESDMTMQEFKQVKKAIANILSARRKTGKTTKEKEKEELSKTVKSETPLRVLIIRAKKLAYVFLPRGANVQRRSTRTRDKGEP